MERGKSEHAADLNADFTVRCRSTHEEVARIAFSARSPDAPRRESALCANVQRSRPSKSDRG